MNTRVSRKAIIREEALRQMSEGSPVSIASVRKVTGGSDSTISAVLKSLRVGARTPVSRVSGDDDQTSNKVEQLLAANREYQLRIAGLSAENATLREQIVTLMSERDTAQVHELDRAIRSSLIASAEEVRSLRYAAKDIGTTAEKLRRESERLTQYAPLPLETHQRIVREPDPVTEERLKRMEASYLRATQEKEKLLRLFTETVGHPPDDF
jgi:hypothetical protein